MVVAADNTVGERTSMRPFGETNGFVREAERCLALAAQEDLGEGIERYLLHRAQICATLAVALETARRP